MSNAREIAMKVIYDVEFNGAYSNMALKKALKTDMPKQDKAFISNLVYGVTDRKLTLDYVIGKFSKIKLKKISKYILIILRMGIYQIMFMDKVPTTAATYVIAAAVSVFLAPVSSSPSSKYILFGAVLVFQLVTLPTEINASRRAMKTLESMYLLEGDELTGARKTLTAAAMTYVAAVASTALQFLRLVLLANRRRD